MTSRLLSSLKNYARSLRPLRNGWLVTVNIAGSPYLKAKSLADFMRRDFFFGSVDVLEGFVILVANDDENTPPPAAVDGTGG